MKNLKAYVDQKNQWNAIFGMAPMDINNDMHRVQIAQTLDGELSPENLHCDGEISQHQFSSPESTKKDTKIQFGTRSPAPSERARHGKASEKLLGLLVIGLACRPKAKSHNPTHEVAHRDLSCTE